MVSGFLISPNDQEAMSSGLAIEMRIWSKAGICTCCLKRLVISFIGSLSWKGAGPRHPFDCIVHRQPLGGWQHSPRAGKRAKAGATRRLPAEAAAAPLPV